MTICLGKSWSFGLPLVRFVNCCQFMYLVISLLVLRASDPDHCLSFTLTTVSLSVSMTSAISSEEEDIIYLFTIYEHGGHLRHMTWTI